MDMEARRGVAASANVANDVERGRQFTLNFGPGHRDNLCLDFRPSQTAITRLVAQAGVVLYGESTALWDRLPRVATSDGRHPLLGEHVGDQVLDIEVLTTSDDWGDDFNLDSDSSIGIDAGFHTTVCACVRLKYK